MASNLKEVFGGSINRLVQLPNRLSVFGASQRERLDQKFPNGFRSFHPLIKPLSPCLTTYRNAETCWTVGKTVIMTYRKVTIAA
jgi:hypothetical protein